ncbi:hypothetical protein AB0953_00535 [Streptomyces sp. NPDC046866]|uniref:hypothetical protein n=1 Tax=Streptomyces sp. NPDC046866 TaxID=3154921 RepID=UPI0034530F6B
MAHSPNGAVFSPDETEPYAADTRAGHIHVFKVGGDDTPSGDRISRPAPRWTAGPVGDGPPRIR